VNDVNMLLYVVVVKTSMQNCGQLCPGLKKPSQPAWWCTPYQCVLGWPVVLNTAVNKHRHTDGHTETAHYIIRRVSKKVPTCKLL